MQESEVLSTVILVANEHFERHEPNRQTYEQIVDQTGSSARRLSSGRTVYGETAGMAPRRQQTDLRHLDPQTRATTPG